MRRSTFAASAILGVMLVLMLAAASGDSATMDELAHIPAGFGYVRELDYRLNPEHPPLIKTLSAMSARIFAKPYFPTDTAAWREDVNGQWTQGAVFLYESDNDADRILFWSRLPLILLAVFFGYIFFRWTRKRFGDTAAILALAFFAFSPTLLAHARYVTTDLGAAFGFFIGIASFIAFLDNPRWRNVAIAGLALGIALLFKFSVVLLAPTYAAMLVVWTLARPLMSARERIKMFLSLAGKSTIIGAIALVLIWAAYTPLVRNYPPARQFRDAEFLLGSYGFRPAVELNLALIRNPLTRGLGEYMLGLLMVQQRSAGGNTAYFLGEVSAAGSRLYFPLLYILKEPLALHIFTLIAASAASIKIIRSHARAAPAARARRWIYDHFTEFSALVFIAIYWLASILSPLNIGVRHVLPTFPFIYMLVARQIADWLAPRPDATGGDTRSFLKSIYCLYLAPIPRYFAAAVLFLWLVAGTLLVFPSFLSYYNELAGGTANGWRIAVDSNYDWGQDLKRLTRFANKNNIQKIAVDYFGGGSPRYYLGERFEPWWSSRGPASGWFAISASVRQGAYGAPAPGFERRPEDSYEWLRQYEPVARAGHSIFIYRLP